MLGDKLSEILGDIDCEGDTEGLSLELLLGLSEELGD